MLASCKHVSQQDEPKSYPKDFSPYVENFEDLFNMTTQTKVVFSDLSDGLPARCLYEAHLIEINENLWASYSETTREALIIHELGHCELGLLHNDSDESHIMSSFIGHNVVAYTKNLEQEILFMQSEDHPRFVD